jgi:hypothetical protein
MRVHPVCTFIIIMEAVSWWRMQEMFHFDGWHLYLLFATAIPTGIISLWIIKKLNIKTVNGEVINIPTKRFKLGLCVRRNHLRYRMGLFRRMPRYLVSTYWNGENRRDSYFFECPYRYIDI